MLNYITNNSNLINEYQNLYIDGIDINTLIDKFLSDELVKHTGFEYGRFEVFIDSCMLLLNKEKYHYYSQNKCGYKDFLTEAKNDESIKLYIQQMYAEGYIDNTENIKLFYSFKKNDTPWDQVAVIRNAMAHMQYGDFHSYKNGLLLFYYLFNKDKGIRKDSGIVVHPILHEFIKAFYSNYSFGMLFKMSLFSKYDFINNRKNLFYNYYEFSIKDEFLNVYNGYNESVISKLAKISKNEKALFIYVKKNRNIFNIKKKSVFRYIFNKKYIRFKRNYNLTEKGKYYYGLKTIFDFDTELSNFLVHIGQLNEILYSYSLLRKSPHVSQSDLEKHRIDLVERLKELREDTDAKLAFDLGFEYLKIVNFLLRLEDDDFSQLDYSKVDVSMFVYDEENYLKFCRKNNNNSSLQEYIITRIRNAIMHGKISVFVDENGKVNYVFTDSYNNRKETLTVSLECIRKFLLQKSLYQNIPQKTPCYNTSITINL